MKTFKKVIVLIGLSALIYIAQILIFHDLHTTAFYIFQDLAFVPISIAITVVAVGAIMDEHEKRDTARKTAMLKSTFFSELGGIMMDAFLQSVRCDEKLLAIITDQEASSLEKKHEMINEMKVELDFNKELYTVITHIVEANKTQLLVISSNPLLLEQECFTQLLWSIFHISDEFRLRGPYDHLGNGDRAHMKKDFTETFKLLLLSYADNNAYLKHQYPSYYHAALSKISGSSAQKAEDKQA